MTLLDGTAPARPQLWLLGARPQTLLLALSPMIVGTAYGAAKAGHIGWLPVLAAALSALFIQIATNMANDAADGRRGHDGAYRLGPLRLTGSGLMSAADMETGAVIASLLAAAFGATAALYGGWPIILIGIASLMAAWAYSYGPWPISRTPFGEVFVLGFFGVAATLGMSWLAAGIVDGTVLMLGLAIGLPACAVLLTNNHRDRVEDAINGRNTLAIVLGIRKTRHLYGSLLLATVLLASLALVLSHTKVAALLLLFAGPALVLARRFRATPVTAELNAMLRATALFQLSIALAIATMLLVAP